MSNRNYADLKKLAPYVNYLTMIPTTMQIMQAMAENHMYETS